MTVIATVLDFAVKDMRPDDPAATPRPRTSAAKRLARARDHFLREASK